MFLGIYFAIDPKPLKLDLLKNGDWFGIAFMDVGLASLVTMLEEGQREDWFGSTYITACGIVALVFIPAFVVTEISRGHPFVNLRLLHSRNLGASSIVGFVLGLALYGSVYLIPLYYTPATQLHLKNMAANFVAKGADPTTAMSQALASLKHTVARDANIMAFNDAFLFVALALVAAAFLVWICKRPAPGTMGAERVAPMINDTGGG